MKNTIRRIAALFTVALGLAFSAGAQAAAPMTTEDAGVLNRSECEIEASGLRMSGATRSNGAAISLSCGVFNGTQLKFGAARMSAAEDSMTSYSLSGKTAVFSNDSKRFSAAVTYGANFQGANGREKHTDSQAALVLTKEYGQLTLHANAGVIKEVNVTGTKKTWATGVEYRVAPRVSVLGETYGMNRSKPTNAMGVRWDAGKDVSVGFMVAKSREANSPRQVLVSMRIAV